MYLAGAALAGTFGTVIPIGGEAVDLALDEPRGVLYVANFTSNCIDVISLSTGRIQTQINNLNNPSSISVSPDDHWLIVARYGNTTAPASLTNGITLIDLTNNYAQTSFQLGNPPLGVAFGLDGNALIVTTSDFELYNPSSGQIQLLATIAQVATNAIPQPPATFPLQFTEATMTTSRDGLTIAGFGGGSPYLVFRYSVATETISSSYYTSSPAGGPRVVSLADDGSLETIAWWEMDSNFNDIAEFLLPSGALNLGTHVIDSSRNLVYAEVPATAGGGGTGGSSTTSSTPELAIMDSDNLETEEQIQIPEILSGKSVLTNDHNTMYSISTSGVTVLPVGSLNKYHRLATSVEDLAFRGNFCNRGQELQTFVISDPGGNATHFSITPNQAGVLVSPATGTTPAVVTVAVDPTAFAGQTGTAVTSLTISSPDNSVIDIPQTMRVAVSSPQPVQRGAAIDIPGTVVDIMADPVRTAYYVLRQDKNQVYVFNSQNNTQTATLRTCTKPTSLAISIDTNYLMVGCDAAHIIPVYDLNLLQEVGYMASPEDYMESIAVSNNAIWAYTRSGVDGTYGLDLINLAFGTVTSRPQLGVWENSTLASQGMVSASPNGANIVYAGEDGGVMIYSAVAGTWVASRGDYASLSGSAAASNYGQYIVQNHLLDSSGAPQADLPTTGGFAAGVEFVNQTGYYTTSAPVLAALETGANSPGTIAQVNVSNGTLISPTPMVESPLLAVTAGLGNYAIPTCSTVTTGSQSVQTCDSTVGGITTSTVTTCSGVGTGNSTCTTQTTTGPAVTSATGLGRTMAVLNDQSAIINLTTSGITVLPSTYAASVALPVINNVVSAADGVSAPAPGGLIEILGSQMSPASLATSEIPLPTALADSCVTINGQPMPLIFVSTSQINAQMPSQASGDVTVQVLTPGGTSDSFNLVVPPTSPAVFLTGTAGPETNIPTIVLDNNGQLVTDSNPIHPGDSLTIYLTGCGQTAPAVPDGQAAPMSPLSVAVTAPAVTLGGMNLPTSFGGLTPGQVGLCQINVSVPGGAQQGLSVPLTITQGSGTQTLNVRVIN